MRWVSADVSDEDDNVWYRPVRFPGGSGSDTESDPGATAYRDYRATQRRAFLVAPLLARLEKVRAEMDRFLTHIRALGAKEDGDGEEFTFDMHDISLDNIFVDETDNTRVTCIIDWESTTVRPLWFCAHVPSFISHSAPHPSLEGDETAEKIFLDAAAHLNVEWAVAERDGRALRAAHLAVEWDGWEEGLVGAALGDDPSGQEEELEVEDYFAGALPSAGPFASMFLKASANGTAAPAPAPAPAPPPQSATVDHQLLRGVAAAFKRNGLG